MLVGWPVGVGKSRALAGLMEAAARCGRYALVAAFFATREVLEEQPWAIAPPDDLRVENLRPRPRESCGPRLDARWASYERRGLGALGRAELCRSCPERPICFWPRQYGRRLRGADAVLGAQAHLERDPFFIENLRQWTRADTVLVLVDESNFVASTARRTLTAADLASFASALRATAAGAGALHEELLYKVDVLLRAGTADLRSRDWKFPRPRSQKWAVTVQRAGVERHGDRFRFLAHELAMFGRSSLESRERTRDGDVSFSVSPFVGCDVAVFSGTVAPEFVRHRVGLDLAAPFAGRRFLHPDTRWFNLCSRLGMRRYFPKNSGAVLDFFAALVAKRLAVGLRPLLVCKKLFLPWAAREMGSRLHELGVAAKVIDGYDPSAELDDPSTVPVINFGAVGSNRFLGFHAAYCLTGFYVTTEAVEQLLQETLATDFRVPIRLWTEGEPPRRRAGAANDADRIYEAHRAAPLALAELEANVVLQAVGRVRPFTLPREIIVFQCSSLPGVEFDAEFRSLEEARKFFGLESRRQASVRATAEAVATAKAQGLTQAQAAERIGLSTRSVRRYWSP